jgi:hypothetical protein
VIEDIVIVDGFPARRAPVTAAGPPFAAFDLVSHGTPLDRAIGFGAAIMDRIAFLAKEEISAESARHESVAIERLAAEVKRLADRPPAPIEVKVPDVYVEIPEVTVNPTPVVIQPPEVIVNVEQPKPRTIRVEEDEQGVKRYVPEEINDDG